MYACSYNENDASEVGLHLVKSDHGLVSERRLTQSIQAPSASILGKSSQLQLHSATYDIRCIRRQRCNKCRHMPTQKAIILKGFWTVASEYLCGCYSMPQLTIDEIVNLPCFLTRRPVLELWSRRMLLGKGLGQVFSHGGWFPNC